VEEVVEGPLRKKRTKELNRASREDDEYDSDIDEVAELDDTEYDITESQGAKGGPSSASGGAMPSGKAKDAKIDAQARKQRSDIHAENMRNKAIREEDFEGSEVRLIRLHIRPYFILHVYMHLCMSYALIRIGRGLRR
jgi:hypothetical protein